MFRIAALNESLSSDGSKSRLPISSATKEAKESEAFVLYNKALSCLRHGEVAKAEEVFRELIQHPFLHEAKESLESSQDHVHPGLQLLYSIHKNMAALATQRGDHIAAVESYLEAIKIDTSEVTVWFKIGTLAVKTENYQLAKFGFQQGLECNPKHWPCLDHLITILFALCNYWACLYYISKGLEMDGNYSKGLALRNQIFKEIPSFRRESQHLWTLCDSEVMERQVDPEEAKEFIDEAEAIRTRRRELAKAPDPPRLKLKPLKSLTWKCVGESLIEMYELATSSNPRMSLGLRVDMSEFKAIDEDISPYNTNVAEEKVCYGNLDSKNEVILHELDMYGTKLSEGGLQISEIKHPPMEIEHSITEPPELGEKIHSVQLGGGDASGVGNKLSNTVMEPMDCTTQMRVPEIHEQKFESSFAVSKEREHSAYPSNASDAVQTERINAVSDMTVLSVLDGCQRRLGNLPSITDVHTLPMGPVSNVSQDGSSTVTHNKLIASLLKESSSDFLNQQQAQFPHTSHTLAPGIIHSSLTGLQMSSTNVVPLLMKPSLTQSELNIISSLAQYNLASGISFSQSTQSGIGLPSHSHSNLDLSSVSWSNLAGQSGLSLVSGAQTGLNLAQSDPSLMSVTKSGINLLPVTQSGISSSRLIQPGLSLTMMSQSGLQQADSLPHRVMFIPVSSPGAPSAGTSLNSVSSSISAILSAVTKALTPPNIPSPLPTYSQAGLLHPKVQAPASEEQPSVQTSLAQELEEKSPIGSKKVQKRKREVQILEELGSKRRSARVRSTTKKKEEECINFYELLQAFLPSSLKQVQDADSMDMDAMDEEQPQVAETQGEVTEGTVAAQSLSEEEKEVKEFLKNSVENSGLISLMLIFVSHLAKRSHRKWPAGLSDIYIKVYMHVRKHISLPQFMRYVYLLPQFMRYICLVWAELQLDQWIFQSKSLTSPITSPRNPTSHIIPNKKLPEFCQDDMGFIMELCAWSNLLQGEWLQHCIRAYWMKARFNMLQGRIEEALFCFNKILEYFNFSKEEGKELKQLVLPNCSLDNTISRDQVRILQESLQRCQSLEETQKFYESGNYHRVVDLLLQTFKSTARQKGKLIGIATALPERHSQLMLLQDSLFKIGNYENCLLWGEESFTEAYQQYRMAKSEQSKKEWTDTMIHIIKALKKLFDKNVTCIRSLPSAKLVRFAQNLVKVVEITMSVPESVTEMPLGTVLPWILLYKLIKHEEDKLKAMQIKESASEHAFDEGIPSSLMLLNIAHEYLGSRSWCTKSDGAFLLCFMDVLKEKMASNQYDKEINQAFEQCVYCLYGHPNKRGRIHLTWDRAIDLFEYFKPKTLPEFDSFKSDTISGEVEHLLKKISQLIPEDQKTVGVSLEDLHNYIEGQTNFPPTMSSERQVKLPIVKELYYLLADYYLKVNKEAGKAIKFYLHDLCVNPTRLDSWAGMALARMSQLEQKLSSIDLRMDVPIYKKSIAALRCFKRAVEVDATNRKLWIEYGSLAYQLHAHSSRQLRWEKWFPVGDELHQIAQDSRQEMLQISYNCYNKASEGEADGTEEKWLTNYMRGKCLEKMRKPPKEYLYYFVKAAKYIHEENAFYPKRITFAYTTPKLAVEALEMYYRLHVAILKYILKSSDTQDYPLYWKYVEEAANSPFARGMEKRHEKKDGRESAVHEENSMPIVTTPNRKSKSYQVPSSDHTYVRQKSNSSSVDKYMSEESFVATESVPATMTTSSAAEAPKDVQLGVPMQQPEPQKGIEFSIAKSVSQVESLKDRIAWVSPSRTEDIGKEIASDNFRKAIALEIPQDPFTDIPVVQRFDSQETTVSKLDENNLQQGMHKIDVMESTYMQRDSDINVLKDRQSGSVSLPKLDDEIDLSINVTKGSYPKPDLVGPTREAIDKTNSQIDKSNQEANKSQHVSIENRSGPVRYPSSQAFSVSKDKSSTTEPGADRRMESEEELRKNIIDKCRAALELCLQRFPTHYKSLYRLAHMYMYSPQHKNLEYARDLLLGNTQWQNISHMPTQGLFADRKQNNFFQGIWKIPIEEIDRSGSFPTHLNRSVALLLELLKEQGDFLMLNKVHMQLLRSPDSGKKYLRDAERVYLAKLAYTTALDVIDTEGQRLKTVSDEEKKIKFMMDAYKVWEYAAPKTAILGDRINDVLAQAYKAIKKTNAWFRKIITFSNVDMRESLPVASYGSVVPSGVFPLVLPPLLILTAIYSLSSIRFCRQQQYEQAMKKTNQVFKYV
ncbi:hypothetical protein ACJMK2_020975 [Sinanodonta woodiana]|uniref:Calcineurin-binding protein cabin-1 n=1 Tax=Sinanodonta woodiana TaxID=1069815 RepID=A0ABD3U0P8_SINWO